jgi:tape measure domain-containing protein
VSYKATIEIGVVGVAQIGLLQKSLNQVATTVDLLNTKQVKAGFNVQNLNTYNTLLAKAVNNINAAALGSEEELTAVRQLVQAKNNQIAAQTRLNALIEKEEILQRKIVATADAGFGPQGPALPPSRKPGAPGKKGGIDATGIISSTVIGGGFPLLFGQGAGAATGGAIGGLVGAGLGAFGGPGGVQAGGFAGSIVGTAVGAAADADQQIQKLAASLDLAGAAAESFGESFRQSGVDLQTFTQSVNQIRDIAIPFEQQATAIKLAAAVSANYKGSITAVSTALQEVGKTGTVSVSTLTELTKAGVPIVDALAKSFGVSKDAVIQMAAEGRVSVDQLLAQLTQLGNQEKTLTGLDKISAAFSSLTAVANKAFGPILDVLGNVLIDILDTVAAGWEYIAQKAIPEFLSAIEPISAAVAGAFPPDLFKKILDLLLGIGLQIITSMIQPIKALAPIVAAVITKFKELSNNPVFKFIAEQVARLVGFLGLGNSEVDQFRAKQEAAKAASAAVTEEERKKLAIALQLQAELNKRVATMQSMQQIEAARAAANTASLNASLQVASAEQQAAGSLQAQLSSINQIASLKTAIADSQYKATKLQVQAEVEAAEAALQQAIQDKKGVEEAQRKLETTRAVATETLRGAAATASAAAYAAELERRMATLAAYTQEYARQTEMAKRYLDLQLNTVNNMEKVTTSVAGAYIQINNSVISTLQAQLQTNITAEKRLEILGRIRALEIANAAYALQAARAQITAEVQRAVLAARAADLEVQKSYQILKQAEALGLVTKAHYDALQAAKWGLKMANDNIDAAKAIADAQWQAADAVYNAAVDAAKMKYETEKAAVAAGKYSNAVNSASGGSGRSGGGTSSGAANGIKRAEGGIKAVLKDPSLPSLQAIADMNAANKQAQASVLSSQKPYDPFSSMSEYGSAQPGNNDTNINITTGPVVEFDGTKYVTLADLEAAMRTTVNGVVSTLRTPAARSALGMS